MKPAEHKRIQSIRNKVVFETGDPNAYIRAVDVAYLIKLVQDKDDEILRLKTKLDVLT